jgi:flavin-dependent dehydrogenase
MKNLYDVVICGGGLAGLTLARQLRLASNGLRIAVIEKAKHPRETPASEVGESTVEAAAHYLGQKLGLHEYLSRTHLLKNGPRFFCGDSCGPLTKRIEIGSSGFPRLPSYQLDRGALAQELHRLNRENDVDILSGRLVRNVEINKDSPHRVVVDDDGGRGHTSFAARWVVDALGRRRFLQHRLGLTQKNRHEIAAAWVHLSETLDINSFTPPSSWHTRDPEGIRYRSTCFFVGRGYWVWLIVLGSGRTSVGVVAERSHFDFRGFCTLDRFRTWLRKQEPVLAERIDRETVQDFRGLPDLSYASRRVFSPDRWACVGDAGVFLDPLYSPGIDMIALGNSLVSDLILEDCSPASNKQSRIEEYNSFYLKTTRTYLKTFRENYPAFENPYVFMAKVYWDTLLYWIYFAPLQIYDVFRDRIVSRESWTGYSRLETRMQNLFRVWAEQCERTAPAYTAYPPARSILTDLHVELARPRTPLEGAEYITDRLPVAEETACALILRAARDIAPDDLEELRQADGLNPYGVSANRADWRRHGMFEPRVSDYANMEMELKYYYGEMSAAQYATVRKLLSLKNTIKNTTENSIGENPALKGTAR